MGLLSRLWPAPVRDNREGGGATLDEELFEEGFLRRLEALVLQSRRIPPGRSRAERRTKRAGSGIEFADHRPYHPGDDLRRLDVNVYQRHDKLLLRIAEEPDDLTVELLLDKSRSMVGVDGTKWRAAKRIAAALGYIALAHLDRLTVTAVSEGDARHLPELRGKRSTRKLFQFLRAIEATGGTALARSIDQAGRRRKRGGLVVLISDLYDANGLERAIDALLSHRADPLVVHVTDSQDASPTARGEVVLTDSETDEALATTLTDAGVRALVREHDRFRTDTARLCAARGVPYVDADARVPLETVILSLFRAGHFLGTNS